MKLLLTSTGLKNQNIHEFFLAQFDVHENKKACMFYTVRTEEDRMWLAYYDNEFKSLGLAYDAVNLSEDVDVSSLHGYDLYYVCGGNTFYILDRMRKTGVDHLLIDEISAGAFYVGVSAGSIIVGPDIAAAGIGNADKNDIQLSDLTGLQLTNHIITPHYNEEEERDVDDFKRKRAGESVVTLTDEQAIFVEENDMFRLI